MELSKSTFLLSSLSVIGLLLTNFEEKQRRNSTNGREESWTEILMRLLEQYLELVSFF
jgi:hypothetical protein